MSALPESIATPGAQVAARILSDANQAALIPGSRLRTERQFAHDLKVTRSEVRHALALLETAGQISRTVGRGTFLSRSIDSLEKNDVVKVSEFANVSPADVMTARSLLETNAMPLAVAYATQQDIEEMDRCLDGSEKVSTYSEFEKWDLALHRSFIVATHNPLLLSFYAVIEEARHGQLWGHLKQRSDSTERRELYRCEHNSIVEAIKERSSDTAMLAMAAHLASVAANLLGRKTPL